MGEYDTERKGFWREPSGTPTSPKLALEAYSREAHDMLVEVATTYHRTVSDADLGQWLQERTSIHTTRSHETWLPQVLKPVSMICARLDEPPLASLVLSGRSGRVGEWYEEALAHDAGRPRTPLTPLEREKHAAFTRLECYRWAGSAPADGGQPAPVGARRISSSGRSRSSTGRAPASRSTAPPRPGRVAKSDLPISVCPTCFMALPATGRCDDCD